MLDDDVQDTADDAIFQSVAGECDGKRREASLIKLPVCTRVWIGNILMIMIMMIKRKQMVEYSTY